MVTMAVELNAENAIHTKSKCPFHEEQNAASSMIY
jgi:hypothetical protein